MGEPILEVASLYAGYGHVPVLQGVDLSVQKSELFALIGTNGAGKSTLLKAIVGLLPPSSGSVRFDGVPTRRMSPEALVRKGVAMVPEGRWLFGPMSVLENLLVGATALRRSERVSGSREGLDRVYELFPVLRDRASQPAATLSGGEQQMLAVGRALMSRPRLLILDEPSLGLAPRVTSQIFSALDMLTKAGLTVLLVEQDARLALRHADRGAVMSGGRVVLEGTAKELLADDAVRSIYLGGWRGEGETA